MLKKITFVALTLATMTSAHAADRGSIIGDGRNLPREIVQGKPAVKRALEINQWILDKGGQSSRNCFAKDKTCVNRTWVNLTGGGVLSIAVYENLVNSARTYVAYCRMAPTKDTIACYNFNSNIYYGNVYDAATKKWTEVFNERNLTEDTETNETAPASSDVEL